jgi:hypothetical protein
MFSATLGPISFFRLHSFLAGVPVTRFNVLAERGPMLRTAETSPSHYLPYLNTNIFQLQIGHLLKMSILVF